MKTAIRDGIVLRGKRGLNVYVVNRILPEFIAKMGRVISSLNRSRWRVNNAELKAFTHVLDTDGKKGVHHRA
jgi:hypothetical protein